jgi:hypothetical protein
LHSALKEHFVELVANYRNLPTLNYEAETNAIVNLVQDLNSTKYIAHASTLNLGNYVVRLKVANGNFNTHFSQRNTEVAATIVYDAKAVRRTMIQNYTAYANYIVSLANAANTPYYNGILDIINTNRKYYSDLLSKRHGSNNVPLVDVNPI